MNTKAAEKIVTDLEKKGKRACVLALKYKMSAPLSPTARTPTMMPRQRAVSNRFTLPSRRMPASYRVSMLRCALRAGALSKRVRTRRAGPIAKVHRRCVPR
jgi:hypothetical protein